MKFPGKRKSKHYFPVNARDPLLQQFQPENETSAAWVVGIDQTLVDIEAKVDDEFIERYGLSAGHSLVIEDDVAEARETQPVSISAGGIAFSWQWFLTMT